MNTRHPHYGTIIAWAEGKTIQYWCPTTLTWRDWTYDNTAPSFVREGKYRVKPETIRYRTFLRRSFYNGGGHYVENVTEEDNKREPREKWGNFVRWIGDWQEVEI